MEEVKAGRAGSACSVGSDERMDRRIRCAALEVLPNHGCPIGERGGIALWKALEGIGWALS